jgi:hypothetical protein
MTYRGASPAIYRFLAAVPDIGARVRGWRVRCAPVPSYHRKTFGCRQATPHPVGFTDAKRMGAALRHDRAATAHVLGSCFSAQPIVAPFPVGREEHRRIDPPAAPTQLPCPHVGLGPGKSGGGGGYRVGFTCIFCSVSARILLSRSASSRMTTCTQPAAKGRSAISLAFLMAMATWRCCCTVSPVTGRGRILPRSEMNVRNSVTSL